MPLPIELFPGKEVWLDDLGEGGLSVSGSSRLELGAPTFLAFEFPKANATIEAAGVIVWCDDAGRAGVRFTRIKPDSTAALKRWLKADDLEIGQENSSPGNRDETKRLAASMHTDVALLCAQIASPNLKCHQVLEVIAERMLRLTRAAGAAIAWREHGNVVCQAAAGNAPEIGTRADMDSSLTGACYRTGTSSACPIWKMTRAWMWVCAVFSIFALC